MSSERLGDQRIHQILETSDGYTLCLSAAYQQVYNNVKVILKFHSFRIIKYDAIIIARNDYTTIIAILSCIYVLFSLIFPPYF